MASPSSRRTQRGFTLIELVVVISILAILSGVLVPRVTNHLRASRDARRLADINAVREAIEQYYQDKGGYPAPNSNSSYGGWDVSSDSDFIHVLTEEGYLNEDARDPLNDATFHYRYYVYAKDSYGCVGSASFYVLGIRSFESSDFAARNKGYFACSGRNWNDEFAYVTGGGASLK
jgi:prepilin-type N-terminal cleavage/methylation domain-containing protein